VRIFATLNLDYASRRKALESLAEDIHPAIQHAAAGVSEGGALWRDQACVA
jgi:hypothetical protein